MKIPSVGGVVRFVVMLAIVLFIVRLVPNDMVKNLFRV